MEDRGAVSGVVGSHLSGGNIQASGISLLTLPQASPHVISLLTKASLPAELLAVLQVRLEALLEALLLHVEDETVGLAQAGLAAPSLHRAPPHLPAHVGLQEVGVLIQEGLHLESGQWTLAVFMLNIHFVKFIRK